jgi:hypothetical protein
MGKVKRTWIKTQNKSDLDSLKGSDQIEIWDGGSVRYERLDGVDRSWEVLERIPLTAESFIEILKELPAWRTPATVMSYEQVPILSGKNGFQIPGWTVTECPA